MDFFFYGAASIGHCHRNDRKTKEERPRFFSRAHLIELALMASISTYPFTTYVVLTVLPSFAGAVTEFQQKKTGRRVAGVATPDRCRPAHDVLPEGGNVMGMGGGEGARRTSGRNVAAVDPATPN